MPIVNTSFVAGKMNKSVDERLLPPGQYVNAINVRLGATETTEVGAVENSKGNTQLTTLAFGGQNLSNSAVCIGAYEDGSKETIYWFIHDANNPYAGGILDLIVSFNTQTNAITYHVTTKQVLNFDPKYLITGVNKIEDLLFWTDDKNPPRKINVTQNYPDPVGISDGINETDISVILKPPGFSVLETLSAPKVTLIDVPGEENYMDTRFITFAYRYRYINNEYSATSLFSVAAFQPGPFRFDVNNFNNSSMKNIYNSAEVEFETGSNKVIEVDLLFKPSNSNSIYVIERFKKTDFGWGNNTKQTYTFTNSKIYTVIGSDELLRLYDNVPKVAKAQTIQGNRLIHGNYTDGYNIVNTAGNNIPINFTTSLFTNDILFEDLAEPTLSTGDVYTINTSTNTTVQNSKINFDLTAQASKLKKGTSLAFTLYIEHSQLNGDTADACYDSAFNNTPFELSLIFPINENYNSVYEMVNSTAFAERIGTVLNVNFKPLATSASGTSLTDFFNTVTIVPTNCVFTKSNSSINAQTQQGFRIGSTVGSNVFSLQVLAMKYISGSTDVYEYFKFSRGQGTFTSSQDTSSLHSNRDYETGIVYMDDYGRASTVLVSEFNTTFVPPSASVDQNRIKVNIENYPPAWANKYKFVLKPSEGGYETIYSNFYYQSQTTRVIYFKLEGDNQNKVEKGNILVVKKDANGDLNREVTCQVLDVSAESSNFLEVEGEAPSNSNQLAGLYMQIRAQNFSINLDENAVVDEGEKTASGTDRTYCNPFLQYPAFTTDPDTSATTNYTVPAQSSINLKWRLGRHDASGCPGIDYIWENTYVSSQNYDDLHAWFQGDFINPGAGDVIDDGEDRLQTPVFINTIATSQGGVQCPDPWTPSFQFWQAVPGDASSPLYLACRSGVIACANGGKTWFMEAEIVVTRSNNLIVWETEPADADPNLFYDSSESYDIVGGFHMGGNGDGDQPQTAIQDAIVTLPFFNCYTFGNGVESYKILDALDGQAVNLGERVLAVSNQDFKEADRFAELTYSGVYSSNSNLNNLNEFNLGLVNFKDLETSFGPIMKLHSRETDILVLQEDKISYVLTGKNLISDSTGGGIIASVPQVLGTQIARIEEYGISHNPESFVSWGYDMYFTDTKRASVLKLTGTSANNDALDVISDTGMRSYFRDQFNVQLNTQKLGGYDPYMGEYVLGTNGTNVPLPPVIIPCGTQKSLAGSTTAQTFTVELGGVIGNVVINYTIDTGTMSVSVSWDGSEVASITNATASGTLNFNKNKSNPTTATVTVTPNPSASYDLIVDCPVETPLVIIQIGLNSSEDSGKFIHNEFKWNDALITSPVASNMMTFGSDSQVASQYTVQTGVRSIGVFPYSGTNVTLRSNKINFDDYDWVVNKDNFAWLSSNTLYNNTSSDITALLTASATIPNIDVNSPSSGLYQATVSNITLPTSNQYLYLIYDYRTTNSASFCYDASNANDACCGCGDFCTPYDSSTVQDTISIACIQPANQLYYHDGLNALPVIGDTVYSSSVCDSTTSTKLQAGFYNIGSSNQWIQVNGSGVVVATGSCAIKSFIASVNDPQISTICTRTMHTTYYHTGANAAPEAGDFCYSDQGITILPNGYYRISSTEYINLNQGTGQVQAVIACPTVTYYPFNTKQQANPTSACFYTGVLDEVYYTTTATGPSDGAGTVIYSDNTGTIAPSMVYVYSVGAANIYFGVGAAGEIDGNGLVTC